MALSWLKRGLGVGSVGALACCVLAMSGTGWAREEAQAANQQQVKPRFDVASIKPCDPHTVTGTNHGTAGLGRVAYTCQPLGSYINQAYRKRLSMWTMIEGGPLPDHREGRRQPELLGDHGHDAIPSLEDRFKLKIHWETRQALPTPWW